MQFEEQIEEMAVGLRGNQQCNLYVCYVLCVMCRVLCVMCYVMAPLWMPQMDLFGMPGTKQSLQCT